MRFDKLNERSSFAKKTPGYMNNRNWERTWVVLEKGTCSELFEARVYCTASGETVGCRAWLSTPDGKTYGFGVSRRVGGAGYDRESTAIYQACVDMGLDITQDDIDQGFGPGRGAQAMMSVLSRAFEDQFGVETVSRSFYGD